MTLGPSLSITQIGKLALDLGYEVMTDRYTSQAAFWNRVCTVRPLAAANHAPFGHRAVGNGRLGTPRKRLPGQPYSTDTVETGYVRQCAIAEYVNSVVIPMEIIDGVGGMAEFERRVTAFATQFAELATDYRDETVATFIQRGTIAAGDTAVFDQSYAENPDANIGKIYDGKPLYAATGNAHPLKSATNTGDQGVNLVASATLADATLDAGYIAVTQTNAVDERGNRISVMPRFLMGGSAMRTAILKQLNSEALPGSANNDVNPNRGLLEPLIWPRLDDDTNAWWIHGPEALEVFDGPNVIEADYDKDIKSMVLRGSFKFGLHCADWRWTYCANKATS